MSNVEIDPSQPAQPSLPWRIGSAATIGFIGSCARSVLYGLNYMEVTGLEGFLELLDKRKDIDGRERGLITVSNHVSVIDDPAIWGVLPYKYHINPANHRWSLGSYDICFSNKITSSFFTLGQVLPTHRGAYSPPEQAGLFQPTMTQALRLLSSQPFSRHNVPASPSISSSEISDPFSTAALTYTTTGHDIFPAPSAYTSRRHSWVHIFPEGRVHQHPAKSLRYFKWGISRMILESEPLPDIVPMFIDGTQQMMHESRKFPRFIPRAGKNVHIAFGEKVDGEQIFGDLRRQWQQLVKQQQEALIKKGTSVNWELGELSDDLKYSSEAVALRKEVTRRVRQEVLKVRRSLGHPDEDPKEGLVETWLEEGPGQGKKKDGSWVGET